MSDARFDEEALLLEAQAAAGSSDFGTGDFREGLRALIQTYTGGVFNARGRRRNRRRLVELLATRLRVQAAFQRHPEIRDRKISRPMVLTGLPRSGTSALFNLLATDPTARPLRLWETQFPDPIEGLAAGQTDPRRDAVEAHFARSREKNPEFTKVHYTSADTPEECVLLHAYAMNGVQMGIEIVVEPYASWLRSQDLRPMYAYYADLLRMLDWQRPGERWLLKAPAHMWAIDVLIASFPDVSIVWSHRDPLLCIASTCSMTHVMMEPQTEVKKIELGPVVMDFYATSLERGLAARDTCDAARFVDVTHDDFVAAPLGVTAGIYEHSGLSVEGTARRAMKDHVRANPKGKHGAHEYTLGQFGLTREQVLSRFADYIERFGIRVGD